MLLYAGSPFTNVGNDLCIYLTVMMTSGSGERSFFQLPW